MLRNASWGRGPYPTRLPASAKALLAVAFAEGGGVPNCLPLLRNGGGGRAEQAGGKDAAWA
jgi:hypothetical protein